MDGCCSDYLFFGNYCVQGKANTTHTHRRAGLSEQRSEMQLHLLLRAYIIFSCWGLLLFDSPWYPHWELCLPPAVLPPCPSASRRQGSLPVVVMAMVPAGYAPFENGRRAYLEYSAEPGLLHERIIAGHVQNDEYVVVTPDFDIFVEQVSAHNVDLDGCRIGPAGGGRPVGLGGAQVYGFGAIAPNDLQGLFAEALDLANQERAIRGIVVPGAPPPAGAVAAAVGPLAPPAALAPAVPVGGAGAAPVPAVLVAPVGPVPMVQGGGWVLDEPLVGHNVGDGFTLPPGALKLGSRALVYIGGEEAVLKFLDAGVDIAAYAHARKWFLTDDERILEPTERLRDFVQAVDEMGDGSREMNPPSPLMGAPTAPWWLNAAARDSRSLVVRSTTWRQTSGIDRNSAFAYEHETISRAAELGITVDGYNSKRSVMFEFLVRRLQLGESAVLENPSQPSFEGARHFLGVSERRGGALVAPSLQAHVATELGKEAAIQKEKRKAREARQNPKGKGRGGQET